MLIVLNILTKLLLGIFILFSGTPSQKAPAASPHKKLVIVLIDGPRWEETWGDPSHQYQPLLRDSLSKEGCLFTNFHNNGNTLTVPGHAGLLTGHYENIANDGSQYPLYPSLGQLFNQKYKTSNNAWLVTSKDKLEIFKTCIELDWKGKSMPRTDCGPAGLGSGYRSDSITFCNAKKVLAKEQPDFMFIQFREPDYSAHANDWQGYLKGIRQGDKYAWKLWKFLQSSPAYKGKTIFVVTNDHGRHPNGIADGFVSHGDGCEGCRHINLFIAGDGIKKNTVVSAPYQQPDLHKTLCKIFWLNDQFGKGQIIKEIAVK
jgi:predicted AlkP superfamily pyrophosphatase or phosphodiesterase